MAHIYIYSSSTAVRDKPAFKRGLKRLQSLGHEVELDATVLASHTRFAGDDATRIAAIARAAASGAHIAMPARGGYGLTRILSGINTKAIAKSIERGTQWVGFSDFTALQAALWVRTGATSWAGPAVCSDFGCSDPANPVLAAATEPDDIMEACFDDLVQGIGEGTGWRMATRDVAALAKPLNIASIAAENPAPSWPVLAARAMHFAAPTNPTTRTAVSRPCARPSPRRVCCPKTSATSMRTAPRRG